MSFRRSASFFSILAVAWLISCIDPVDIVEDIDSGDLVVDALITDQPGPYFVTLARTRSIKTDLDIVAYVRGALVLLDDDAGNLDTLREVEPGRYQSSQRIRGQVGRKYRLQIRTKESFIYQTDFQEMLPVGTVDSAYFKLTKKYFLNEDGFEELKYDFDLAADGTLPVNGSNFVMWRWKGTYEVFTYPKLRTRISARDPDFGDSDIVLPDPPRCSGFIFIKELYIKSGVRYYSLGEECTCCKCWVNEFSSRPVLTSNRFKQNKFFDVALGSISAQNVEPFRYKYHVGVEMLSVNEEVYQYFETVSTQGSNNLFVPPIGQLRSNVRPVDGSPEVYGMFRVSAVSSRSFFIPSSKLPFGLNQPVDSVRNDCRAIRNSTTEKPDYWD